MEKRGHALVALMQITNFDATKESVTVNIPKSLEGKDAEKKSDRGHIIRTNADTGKRELESHLNQGRGTGK